MFFEGMKCWSGLGNKSTLVKVRERSWFQLNVNKHIVPRHCVLFFCIKPRPRPFPNINQVLPEPKHNHKKSLMILLSLQVDIVQEDLIFCQKTNEIHCLKTFY